MDNEQLLILHYQSVSIEGYRLLVESQARKEADLKLPEKKIQQHLCFLRRK